MRYRVGLGNDLHILVPGDGIALGGIIVPCPYSVQAVSDGDVLLHALVDALLGAVGKGDIGDYYPENRIAPGQNSALFVTETLSILAGMKARIVNVDCIINLETPRLGGWKGKIRERLSDLLSLPSARINVKAKTGEGIGPIGESRAASAEVVVLLEIGE